MKNSINLVDHFNKVPKLDKKQKISSYTRPNGYINTCDYRMVVLNLLRYEPFFKRFDIKTLSNFLGNIKPEIFQNNDLVFLDNRVGVIVHGSVRIKNHSDDILNPTVLGKYGEGKILGHDSDNGITNNSQSWIITYDDETEILFFSKADFNQLWKIQLRETGRQIIEANIECNKLLRCLSD